MDSGRLLPALLLALAVLGCASAPYTGRRQLMLTSEAGETSMGYQAFRELKQHFKESRDPEINGMVQRVGKRIAAAANRPDFRWEFVVFEAKQANAFCLPGGKVGIFTGILKYTRDEGGLATVMAHEAAHAISRHAGERMSQSMMAQLGAVGLGVGLTGVNPTAGRAIMTGYDLGAKIGILLPYSRTQEYEADRVGLILMAKAGYDPALALEFWQRLMAKDRGPGAPEFLSTHPRDTNRIREMVAFMPQARKYYAGPADGASAGAQVRPQASPQAGSGGPKPNNPPRE